ncbi:unnamed protein product [Ceratitis capitata]|uniref:(Mediterranean fruit fly) hypothetical protein n=1 Tax=Ceratitis capitata TaxID=7213 RepID=A0A811V5L9_CERCA|nr:unnamed protein product [Ceratitis capitata]
MGKKNKNKKTGQTGDEPQGHQEQSRPQQQPLNQQCPLNPQREGEWELKSYSVHMQVKIVKSTL